MTVQTQLNEARDAYHKLMTGQAVVSIQRDGKTVQFAQADRPALRAYIMELEGQLSTSGGAGNRRPARVSL